MLHRSRTTVLLAAMAAMLAALLVIELRYVDQRLTSAATADRPVATGEATHRAAVRAAAAATAQALSYGHEDFDEQVEAATEEMTDAFATRYRRTTSQARERFLEERTTQEVRVAASSVVTADDERVTALLFIDQYVARAGAGTTVSPYRALVTVVRDEGRWLVADIRTR